MFRTLCAVVALAGLAAIGGCDRAKTHAGEAAPPAPQASAGAPASAPGIMPRYAHIFVIIEENHTFDQVIGEQAAPNFNRLAKEYGLATNFYAEQHPSEPNYIAMLGGDTFGITDDDAFYCKPNPAWQRGCDNHTDESYVDHTITAKSLADQLQERGLTWKGYFEDIPSPGAGEDHWPTSVNAVADRPNALYAVKHNGFMFFKSVQDDPDRAKKIVGFDALNADIADDTLPNFAHIVPNQCNDMHGLQGAKVPDDCDNQNDLGRIKRADDEMAKIVTALTSSAMWKSDENAAIIITFDENDDHRPDSHGAGCCGSSETDLHNPGGGWIPTIVITNHGPRGLQDPTPYNHYSMLRTIEDGFGITKHLGHAADDSKGVVDMTPLFAVTQ
jgi:phosphatidylinositol-3-phosphatase